jgi:hypothetical protein
MSAHPAPATKPNAVPPVISTTTPAKHGPAGKDTEPTSPEANPTAGSPLEPHWEPVVSAATD